MTEWERQVNNHTISVPFPCHNVTEHAICLICRQGWNTSALEAIQDRWSTSLITTRQHFSCVNSQQLRDQMKFSVCSIWLCRLGLLDRGSIWPWFGSTGAGSCRVFLAFPMFQNKLHVFSLHQLHPKYLLLQFSRMQQPLWQCCWASVPSHTSKIRRTNMQANLLY